MENYFINRRMQFSVKNPEKDYSLIRVRTTVNGVRMSHYLPMEYKIKTAYWDKSQGKAIVDPKRNPDLKGNPHLQTILYNTNKEIEKTTNAMLISIENLKLRGITPSADLLKAELLRELNKTQAQSKRTFSDLSSFIDYYVNLCREGKILNAKGAKLKAGSLRNYLSTQRVLKMYSKSRRATLRFESITIEFYNDFVKFLNDAEHNRGKYKPNVIGKFVKNIKVFMRYAYENQFTTNDDYKKRDFRVFQENAETIYLTDRELDAIYRLELPDHQAQIRDAFLVSCYTALRYSDIARLEQKHINLTNNTITIITQKTNTPVVIPIHKIVREILSRYDNQPPRVQCNQVVNRRIKEICQRAGITELIMVSETRGGVRQEQTYEKWQLVTSHTARRSFASNAYKRGIPSLSIMQITGHKTESSFMRYIRITKEENALALQNHEFFNT